MDLKPLYTLHCQCTTTFLRKLRSFFFGRHSGKTVSVSALSLVALVAECRQVRSKYMRILDGQHGNDFPGFGSHGVRFDAGQRGVSWDGVGMTDVFPSTWVMRRKTDQYLSTFGVPQMLAKTRT